MDDRPSPMDYHDPTAGIAGAPPARSALGMRFGLAIFGLFIFGAGAIAFGIVGNVALCVLLAIIAATALVDLVVIRRRMRREGPD